MPSIPRIDFLDTTVDDFFKTRNNENASSQFRTLPYEKRRTLQLSFEINCSETIIRLGYEKKDIDLCFRFVRKIKFILSLKLHEYSALYWIFCMILQFRSGEIITV